MGLPIVLSSLEPALERRDFPFSSLLYCFGGCLLLYCTHYLDGVDDIQSLCLYNRHSLLNESVESSPLVHPDLFPVRRPTTSRAEPLSPLRLQSLSLLQLTRHGQLWNHLHEEIFFFVSCSLSCSSALCPPQLTFRSLSHGWCGRACAPRLAVIIEQR